MWLLESTHKFEIEKKPENQLGFESTPKNRCLLCGSWIRFEQPAGKTWGGVWLGVLKSAG